MAVNCIIICGDLRGFTSFSTKDTSSVEDFCTAFQGLVAGCMHTDPIFTKFLGDGFIYLYEFSDSRTFLINVLRSVMALQKAYAEASSSVVTVGTFKGISEFSDVPKVLGIGMSLGRVFFYQDPMNRQDVASAYINLAMKLAQEAKSDSCLSNILIDSSMNPDGVYSDLLLKTTAGKKLATHKYNKYGLGNRTARIVDQRALDEPFAEYQRRQRIIPAMNEFQDFLQSNAIPKVFKFDLRALNGEAEVQVEFNPLNFRGRFSQSEMTSIRLYVVSENDIVTLPEILVQSGQNDQRFTRRVPLPLGRRFVFGASIQHSGSERLPDPKRGGESDIISWFDSVKNVTSAIRTRQEMVCLYYRY